MTKAYTLAKGRALSHRQERGGKTPHFHLLLDCGGILARLSINTRSGSSRGKQAELLFLANDDYQHPIIDELTLLDDGLYEVATEPGGLAIDYQRGGHFDPRDLVQLPASRPGSRNDLSDELLARATRAINDPGARVYAWGTRWGPEPTLHDHIFDFIPGNGLHDIHMNQGNTDEHRHDNRAWADGALMVQSTRLGRWSAIFLAFQTQSWNTDETGNPRAFRKPGQKRG